jgi:outer membrane protein TolC
LSTDFITKSDAPRWLYGISTSFLLEPTLVRQLRAHIAEAGVRAARLDYADAIWTVRRDLRAAVLAVAIADRRIALLTAAQQLREQLSRMMQDRVIAGEAAPSEQLQLAVELTRARSALADAQHQRDDALTRLAAVIGLPIRALSGIQFEIEDMDQPPPVDPATLDRLRDQALLSRTDLERAAVDYDVREMELHQQVRLQYPQIALGPGYTFDHGIPTISFGASFALPILNQNQGAIGEAEARRASAARHVTTIQAQVLNEIDGGAITYQHALANLELTTRVAADAHRVAAQIERGVAVGAEDTPTLLAAQLAANTEDLSVIDALDRAQQALAQLEDALRTPLHGAEMQLKLPDPSSDL